MESWIREFQENLKSVGVNAGDMLYISSDLMLIMFDAMRLCGVRKEEQRDVFLGRIVDCVQEILGEDGTILIPMFTWQLCQKKHYDAREANGEVGALGNWVLEHRKEFARTKHPIYSFMVWGKRADSLLKIDNYDAWGDDSPFAFMHHNKAKNLLIDTTLERAFTFAHYVEDCVKVPYRYIKEFSGEYIDSDGIKSEKKYAMFVRNLDIESKQVTPDECLVMANVAKKISFGCHTLQLVDLEKAFPVVKENIMNHNADQWYEFTDYVIEWT